VTAVGQPVGFPAVDLFCGAGALSLGLSSSGWQVVAAVDNDRDSLDTYQSHHPHTEVAHDDIATIKFKHFRGDVALVAGGCRPRVAEGRSESTRFLGPYHLRGWDSGPVSCRFRVIR
jgi:DNA (cytosine-5)-methyltransferase 1